MCTVNLPAPIFIIRTACPLAGLSLSSFSPQFNCGWLFLGLMSQGHIFLFHGGLQLFATYAYAICSKLIMVVFLC